MKCSAASSKKPSRTAPAQRISLATVFKAIRQSRNARMRKASRCPARWNAPVVPIASFQGTGMSESTTMIRTQSRAARRIGNTVQECSLRLRVLLGFARQNQHHTGQYEAASEKNAPVQHFLPEPVANY